MHQSQQAIIVVSCIDLARPVCKALQYLIQNPNCLGLLITPSERLGVEACTMGSGGSLEASTPLLSFEETNHAGITTLLANSNDLNTTRLDSRLLGLPVEVLLKIFCNLDFQDLQSLASTSKLLRRVFFSHHLYIVQSILRSLLKDLRFQAYFPDTFKGVSFLRRHPVENEQWQDVMAYLQYGKKPLKLEETIAEIVGILLADAGDRHLVFYRSREYESPELEEFWRMHTYKFCVLGAQCHYYAGYCIPYPEALLYCDFRKSIDLGLDLPDVRFDDGVLQQVLAVIRLGLSGEYVVDELLSMAEKTLPYAGNHMVAASIQHEFSKCKTWGNLPEPCWDRSSNGLTEWIASAMTMKPLLLLEALIRVANLNRLGDSPERVECIRAEMTMHQRRVRYKSWLDRMRLEGKTFSDAEIAAKFI
ncbi:hypothetical protein ABW19_dt0208057 [Dactylella cylindrospora]|nr:hypothetical protein ABW19_dt0208057 [Dactylella cylindrospora]